jgi:hypothetical protein
MEKSIARVWTFASDSNPAVEYETLQYTDRSTSCNCKGWTRRVAANGSRSCKHTRLVDLGQADRHCRATHNYQTQQQRKVITNDSRKIEIPKLGRRKFAL